MEQYKETIESVVNDTDKQNELINRLFSVIREGGYVGVVIFCGNYLVGINMKNEIIACVPESFVCDGKILDQDSFDICTKMGNERFDTKFSLFSLKVGLELFSKIDIDKQLLLSADDKYIDGNKAKDYLRAGYMAIPPIYRRSLEECLGGAKGTKAHLHKIISILCEKGLNKKNEFVLSERSLVKGFDRKKGRNVDGYVGYLEGLGKDRTSCSLEIFHLLTLLKEQKTKIFENNGINDKVVVCMFVPDACVSSAMQGGLAVAKTDETFEIINITQMTTVEEGVIMITKITKDGVVRL